MTEGVPRDFGPVLEETSGPKHPMQVPEKSYRSRRNWAKEGTQRTRDLTPTTTSRGRQGAGRRGEGWGSDSQTLTGKRE